MKQVERFFEDTVDTTKDFFSAEEMMEDILKDPDV